MSFIAIFALFIINRKLLHIQIGYSAEGERFLCYIVMNRGMKSDFLQRSRCIV